MHARVLTLLFNILLVPGAVALGFTGEDVVFDTSAIRYRISPVRTYAVPTAASSLSMIHEWCDLAGPVLTFRRMSSPYLYHCPITDSIEYGLLDSSMVSTYTMENFDLDGVPPMEFYGGNRWFYRCDKTTGTLVMADSGTCTAGSLHRADIDHDGDVDLISFGSNGEFRVYPAGSYPKSKCARYSRLALEPFSESRSVYFDGSNIVCAAASPSGIQRQGILLMSYALDVRSDTIISTRTTTDSATFFRSETMMPVVVQDFVSDSVRGRRFLIAHWADGYYSEFATTIVYDVSDQHLTVVRKILHHQAQWYSQIPKIFYHGAAVVAYRNDVGIYLATIDSLDKPFAQLMPIGKDTLREVIQITDVNNDNLPDLVATGNQYWNAPSSIYVFSLADIVTSVSDDQVKHIPVTSWHDGMIEINGLEPARYEVSIYTLLGVKLASMQVNIDGPQQTTTLPLPSSSAVGVVVMTISSSTGIRHTSLLIH